jgi:hypothetical protein
MDWATLVCLARDACDMSLINARPGTQDVVFAAVALHEAAAAYESLLKVPHGPSLPFSRHFFSCFQLSH